MKYQYLIAPWLIAVVGLLPATGRADSSACEDFKAYATQGKDDASLKTDTLLVMKGGQEVYKWHDDLFGYETPHCLFSGSKSIMATLLGIAVKDGRVSLDQKLVDIFPEAVALRKSLGDADLQAFKRITIYDLLHMQSGMQWRETDNVTIRNQTGLRMLYTEGALDTLSFALKQPMEPAGPGGIWSYSSGSTEILMGVLQKAYGKDDMEFPWRELFKRIGMDRTVFSPDAAGNFVGSAYVFTSLREMANLGQLYLNGGTWNGSRILPEGWTQVVSTRAPATGAKATLDDDIKTLGVYGGGFWVNQGVPEKGLPKPFPRSPDDVYAAIGHFGQFIIVIPSQDMVIARTGHDTEFVSKIDGLITKAIQCYGGSK